MRRIVSLLILAAVLAPLAALAVGTPIPKAPVMWCTDKAGFLSEQAQHDVDFRLFDFERKNGNQVIVYIDKTTGGISIEEWAVKAFSAWGIGKKGKDDGVALFIFSEDQTLRIEVGYGLEGQLPDAICSRIIDEIMTPKIKAGDRDGAVKDGVEAILAVVSGQPLGGAPAAAATERPQASQGPTVTYTGTPLKLWHKIIIGILLIGFLILLITHPSFALWLLFELVASAVSGGSGGGGGGGGFSGGGGSSGGGGASGSW